MPNLNINPSHKPIKQYYAELQEYDNIGAAHEGAVRTAFQNLLQHYSRQADLILVCEKTRSFPPDKGGQGGSGRTAPNRRIRPDGEVVDTFGLPYGYWEAKDTQDDLYAETSKKFAAGYPSKNIVIQSPTHALLYLFVKKDGNSSESPRIFYYRTDDLWDKKQKFSFLNESQHAGNIQWQTIQPDARQTWLTEGFHSEFDAFIPMGTKETKATKGKVADVIFKTYSSGVKTNRDAWAYNFNRDALAENMRGMIETYNEQIFKWERRENQDADVDDFVISDDEKIGWSSGLKLKLKSGQVADFSREQIRASLYRPFTKSNLYFDRMMTERVYVFPSIFPALETEMENRVIWLKVGREWPMFGLMVNRLAYQLPQSGSQCFPFYTYDEDGTNRRENVTDWALTEFRTHYNDDTITKWDIFHYTYGLLHHPDYREKYEANLKRDLPHIPTPLAPLDRGVAADFWGFAKAGARLADLHVNYESQPEYDGLKLIQNPDVPLDWRVEKMKLSKDKTSLVYNNFLTISGIPEKVYAYRLGNRSALEWIINQYCVKIDKRSGIVNDPNRADDPQYIVKLIGKVITVSLETVKVVESLPDLDLA